MSRVIADACAAPLTFATFPHAGHGMSFLADPERYKELTALQADILSNALRYVRPGGRVMYSTCTLNRDENEKIVKQILSNNHGSLSIIELDTLLPYNGKVGFFYGIIEKNDLHTDRTETVSK